MMGGDDAWRRKVGGIDGLQYAAPFAEERHALLVIAGEQSVSRGRGQE